MTITKHTRTKVLESLWGWGEASPVGATALPGSRVSGRCELLVSLIEEIYFRLDAT
jgi:hypothetical protein